MSAAVASSADVLDAVQKVAPYLRWRVRINYSNSGEQLVAIGGFPSTNLTPEEARAEAERVLLNADWLAHIRPRTGVSVDVHVVAADGHEYPAARLS